MFVLFLLLLSPLLGDELTVDPPVIWEADCLQCRPYQPIAYPICESEESVVVDLLDPRYENGIVTTEHGGVLTTRDLRIQAQKIIYTRNLESEPPVFTVQCEGNLLVDYKEWVLVGDTFYYDFLTHRGYITCGRTGAPPWFVGGEEIQLLEGG